MRVAIVGAGVIGTVHARLISSLPDQATLVAVADIDFDRAKSLAERYGATPYPDAASAYAAEEIDAVGVCIPSAYHPDAAIAALAAGKHVLIEKPLGVSLEGVDRLIAAERETDRVVSTVSQRRFQPAALFIKRAIDRGYLGRVTSGIAESAFYRSQEYYESGDWRGTAAIDGGGALMNQGIHALDLLVWMLGAPVEVTARTAQLAHERIEVEDVASATITFDNGALGVLLASTAAYPGQPVRITIHGDQGTAVMDDDRVTVFESAVADRTSVEEELAPKDEELDALLADGWTSIDLAHRAQYRDWLDAIASGRTPAVSTAAGRRSLAVVLGVYESAGRGQPVQLGEV